MPAGQTSGSNKPCGEVQYWPSILRLLQVGLGLHMAATEEALVKFAAGAMKPGGMTSVARGEAQQRRSKGASTLPRAHDDGQEKPDEQRARVGHNTSKGEHYGCGLF